MLLKTLYTLIFEVKNPLKNLKTPKILKLLYTICSSSSGKLIIKITNFAFHLQSFFPVGNVMTLKIQINSNSCWRFSRQGCDEWILWSVLPAWNRLTDSLLAAGEGSCSMDLDLLNLFSGFQKSVYTKFLIMYTNYNNTNITIY